MLLRIARDPEGAAGSGEPGVATRLGVERLTKDAPTMLVEEREADETEETDDAWRDGWSGRNKDPDPILQRCESRG